MSIVLMGSTSGSITLSEPAVAGSNTISLPAVTGTVVVAGQNSAITAGTAVASTSGASIDFTSIPSWVKRVTVMFDVVSQSSATSPAFLIQLGTSGGIVSTGYVGTCTTNGGSNAAVTTGFGVRGPSAASAAQTGAMTIMNITGNTWVANGVTSDSTYTQSGQTSGKIALGGTLTQLRVVANGGAFNAGTINILYE
jgi:hypothetical protein